MTGPKHLWSGDWEEESAARTSGAANRSPADDSSAGPGTPAPDPEPGTPNHRRNGLIAGGVTVAVLAIVAIVIAATAGSNAPSAPTTAASAPTATTQQTPTNPIPTNPSQSIPTNPSQSTPTNPTPTNPTTPTTPSTPTATSATATTPTVPPRPVTWLGMEVITVPNGTAVVDTVTPGSAGDLAGLNPADRISAINGHAVTGSTSIAKVVSGIHKGTVITLTIDRGGTTLHPQATFTGPPTPYP